ncbi:hypothetical protein [Nocardia jinanensis]|uniref:Uncharacterized protein n=1 Tax=Nocardia jinanensis TaxID=382504 RepID=A0A917VKF0_9NOCA|nr:hypothetical protein [Nocardia jinanensis]GGK93936.1 hypothetical protein GCM10011588_05620 [Nocardia jinanensis]
MRPIDTTAAAGVIAPELQQAVPTAPVRVPETAAPSTQPDPGAAIQDVPLAQLPDGEQQLDAPEFFLSQRISDDAPAAAGAPMAGLPGLSGLGGDAADAQDILSGAAEDASDQANQLLGAVNQAAAPVVDTAQGVLGQVLNTAAGGGPSGTAAAGGAPAAAAPALPSDPVGALLGGAALPALPGIDVLFQPIRDLLSSFGTGVIGALDPTAILSQSSQIIETAMSVGKSSLTAMGQVWESDASQTAQTAGQEANNSGLQTSQRGIDIAALTQAAASVVQQGNAQLSTIATSFIGQAVALAPVVMTPPAQTALIASATEHLGQAVIVANATRGDLAGKTAELGGMVQSLTGVNGQQAAEAAQSVAQSVGEPIMQQAQSMASDTSGLESVLGSSTGDPAATTLAGLNSGSPGTTPGSPGLTTGSPGLSTGSPSGTPGIPGSPSVPGVPGAAQTPLANVLRPGPATGMPAATTPASSSFMGGGAPGGAAGQRNSDEEHSRTVDPYRSATGNDDLTGPLGESAPEVIGAVDADEDAGYDNQF